VIGFWTVANSLKFVGNSSRWKREFAHNMSSALQSIIKENFGNRMLVNA